MLCQLFIAEHSLWKLYEAGLSQESNSCAEEPQRVLPLCECGLWQPAGLQLGMYAGGFGRTKNDLVRIAFEKMDARRDSAIAGSKRIAVRRAGWGNCRHTPGARPIVCR